MTFLFAATKYWTKRILRKEGFILVYSLRGNSRWQARCACRSVTADHKAFIVRKQSEMNVCAQLPLSFLFCPGPQPMWCKGDDLPLNYPSPENPSQTQLLQLPRLCRACWFPASASRVAGTAGRALAWHLPSDFSPSPLCTALSEECVSLQLTAPSQFINLFCKFWTGFQIAAVLSVEYIKCLQCGVLLLSDLSRVDYKLQL